MRRIVILGSTGSIGTQALDVIRANPGEFQVIGLSAHSQSELFEKQIREFEPRHVALTGMSENPSQVLEALASLPEADLVLNALSGSHGLAPTLAACRYGKVLALANKESIVMAGELVMQIARSSGAKILPVDSEPSALWQMLRTPIPAPIGYGTNSAEHIEKIILTASGGPFWKWKQEELSRVTAAQALNHPTWKMGEKVSIDSATLMNKAFEIIETRWLFDIPSRLIDVVVHRQSLVHSFVQYADGNMQAVLSPPDMRIPIAHALFYPTRAKRSPSIKPLDLSQVQMTFEKPDYSILEGPRLAYEALEAGGIMPAVFCLADEIAVSKFLRGEISFLGIYDCIKNALERVKNMPLTLESLKEAQKFL